MKKLFSLFIFIMICSACSTNTSHLQYVSSRELIDSGKELMDEKKYSTASKYFEQAVLNSYLPSESEEAQRLKGDSYFLNKKYLDAIAAYEVYYDIYDNTQYDSIILYRIAVSYYNKSLKPGRDNFFTEKSIQYFNTLKRRFPGYYDSIDAQQMHKEMIEKIAISEYNIGRFYLRTDHFESAINRFVYIINNYPDISFNEKVYESLIDASFKAGGRTSLIIDYIVELKEINAANKNIQKYENELNKLN